MYILGIKYIYRHSETLLLNSGTKFLLVDQMIIENVRLFAQIELTWGMELKPNVRMIIISIIISIIVDLML